MSAHTSPPTVHLIGHAHIDPVWLWRWQEGFAEAKATFRAALDRMRETPGYIFTSSSAALYAWVEDSDPAMFREIQQRVDEGRWALAGGWWIEPDCNLPAGESLVRQGLYGQRYFREKFGRLCRVGFCVDSFGHPGTLPKILAGCRLRGYVFMRPQRHEDSAIPPLAFRWRADDGTQVNAMRIPQSYNATHAHQLDDKIAHNISLAQRTPLKDHTFAFYGVGNHGGGPTRQLLERISAWQHAGGERTLRYATVEQFLDHAGSCRLPVWKQELQHHARGCYAAVSAIKQGNRRAEGALIAAEMWGVAAFTQNGRPAETATLGGAWRQLLFNQFHDILAGSSVREACEDAVRQQGGVLAAAEKESNAARQSLSWRIDTRGDGAPLVVFNDQPFPYRGVVETDDVGFLVDGSGTGEPALTDADGRPIPCQPVTPHTICGRRRFAVVVDIPALGYVVLREGRTTNRHSARLLGKAAVRVRTQRAAATPASHRRDSASTPRAGLGRTLENEYLRLGLDGAGYLTLYDRRYRRAALAPGSGVPLVIQDHSDTWSHDVDAYLETVGRFALEEATILESGPVRARLVTHYRWQDSRLSLEYTLGAGEPFVRVAGRVDWRQQWQLLKLCFAIRGQASTWTAEVPFGTAERATHGQEEPVQRWVDVSVPGRGLAIANDSRYACSAAAGELRVTILRSPPYAFHHPFQPADFAHHEFTEQGVQRFQLALVPHGGDWRTSGIIEIARQLNQPPTTLSETFHPGPLASRGGFVACRGKGVYVETLKEAEEGDALILRAVEWFGRARTARFTLAAAGAAWSARFRPHEVKTFRIPLKGGRVAAVDMLEE